MKIYHYSRFTGEFLGEEEADLDPIKGEPMIPAHATTIRYPDVIPDHTPVFENGAWRLALDKRGAVYYLDDGLGVEIVNFDVDIPAGATLVPKPSHEHKLVDGVWELKSQPEIDADKKTFFDAAWKADPKNDTLMLVLYELYKLATGTNPTKAAFWNAIKDRFIDPNDNFFDF